MQAKVDAAAKAYEALKNKAAGTALAETAGELMPSAAQHERALQGTMKDTGITGRASQTTYNLRTQQIAENAKKQAQVIESLRRLGILTGEVPVLDKFGTAASTASGVTAPASAIDDYNAKQIAKSLPQSVPKGKIPSFLSYIGKLSKYPVTGAFTGATAGLGIIDAYNRYFSQKDPAGAAVSGLGTSAALAAPFVSSMGALPSASIAAPLYLMAKDRLEYLKKHPEEIRLETNQYDAMGNPIGGGGLP